MDNAYFTQNTIADALIDLSQSSAAISSVKDGSGADNEQHVYKTFH